MCSTTKECQTTSCPFAMTDLSETVQNYGCLPTPHEIMTMRVEHGKTWACHSDPSKPCAGALKRLEKDNLPYKVIDPILITEADDWSRFA